MFHDNCLNYKRKCITVDDEYLYEVIHDAYYNGYADSASGCSLNERYVDTEHDFLMDSFATWNRTDDVLPTEMADIVFVANKIKHIGWYDGEYEVFVMPNFCDDEHTKYPSSQVTHWMYVPAVS